MMMPALIKKGWIGAAAILAGVAAAVWWPANPPFSSVETKTNRVAIDVVAHLFEKLGIITDHGMSPSVDFELADLTGRRVRLSDFTGKVVFLNFWTTWCPECRTEMPALEKLYQRFKDREFALLAVSLRESEINVSQYVDRKKLNFKILLDSDGQVGRNYGIHSIPTTIIIGKDGATIGKVIGPRKWSSPIAKVLIDQLINSSLEGSTTGP